MVVVVMFGESFLPSLSSVRDLFLEGHRWFVFDLRCELNAIVSLEGGGHDCSTVLVDTSSSGALNFFVLNVYPVTFQVPNYCSLIPPLVL